MSLYLAEVNTWARLCRRDTRVSGTARITPHDILFPLRSTDLQKEGRSKCGFCWWTENSVFRFRHWLFEFSKRFFAEEIVYDSRNYIDNVITLTLGRFERCKFSHSSTSSMLFYIRQKKAVIHLNRGILSEEWWLFFIENHARKFIHPSTSHQRPRAA